MAVKNLQKLVQCVANMRGVVVTGTCKETMRADGNFQAPFLSLPSLVPLAGPFPIGMQPDNQGVLRTGRSARMLGVSPSTGAMQTWPMSPSASYHREQKAIYETAILVVG